MNTLNWLDLLNKSAFRAIVLVLGNWLFFSCTSENDSKKELGYPIPISITEEVKDFLIQDTTYNSDTYFLIDFAIYSGDNRFFVYSVAKDSIVDRGLVTRGSCRGKTANSGERYSNTEGSYCSSLGKYTIGNSYQGDFGLAYKLYGLDSTNSNAYERFIVLHSHSCVPNHEVAIPICLSQGCPTVSPEFLERLATIIDQSPKPILLYLVDSSST